MADITYLVLLGLLVLIGFLLVLRANMLKSKGWLNLLMWVVGWATLIFSFFIFLGVIGVI